MSSDRELKDDEEVLFELLEKRCIDLEYLLLSTDANTSLGEDLPAERPETERGGSTRLGKFTGRRRL